eukprot:jgi/Chlat1/6664/Chrsp49S06153
MAGGEVMLQSPLRHNFDNRIAGPPPLLSVRCARVLQNLTRDDANGSIVVEACHKVGKLVVSDKHEEVSNIEDEDDVYKPSTSSCGHGVKSTRLAVSSTPDVACFHMCEGCRVTESRANQFALCPGCALVHYCSTACRRVDWPEHRERCSMVKVRRERAAAERRRAREQALFTADVAHMAALIKCLLDDRDAGRDIDEIFLEHAFAFTNALVAGELDYERYGRSVNHTPTSSGRGGRGRGRPPPSNSWATFEVGYCNKENYTSSSWDVKKLRHQWITCGAASITRRMRGEDNGYSRGFRSC